MAKVTFIAGDLGSIFKGRIKAYDWIDIKFKQLNSIKAAFIECLLCIGHRNDILRKKRSMQGYIGSQQASPWALSTHLVQ